MYRLNIWIFTNLEVESELDIYCSIARPYTSFLHMTLVHSLNYTFKLI